MKRKVGYWLLLSISVILFGCSNDEEINRDFTFIGTVIDASSKEPMPELPVVVTDGNNIHTSTKTNADGRFMLTVNINEISSAYYILIGDDSCIKKTVEIHGFSGGETNLGTIEIIGPSIPSVRLNGHKTDNGIITCNASITANGRLEVVEKGFCFGKTAQPTIDDEKIVCGSGDESFQGKITITDLDVSSTYFIRPYATNAKGTGYGEEFSTSTEDGLPSIESLGAGSIKATSASLGGRLISNGGYEVTERGVCWDKDGTPSVEDNYKFIDGQETINYWIDVDGLSPNTKYYMRAYAKNKHGIAYGGIESFTTKDGLPSVETTQVKYGTTILECYGNVTKDGGFPIIRRGFCYSTHSKPTLDDKFEISTSNIVGEYSLTIDNLEEGTTYYVRAFVENEKGISYGDIKSATTMVTTTFRVVDTDNTPIPDATIYFGSTSTSYKCDNNGQLQLTNSVGTWKTFWASADGYNDSEKFRDKPISKYNKEFTITLSLIPISIIPDDLSLSYSCDREEQFGKYKVSTLTIYNPSKNNKNFSFNNVPDGIKISSNNGNINANESLSIDVTFTYPGPSVQNSLRYDVLWDGNNNPTQWLWIYDWDDISDTSSNLGSPIAIPKFYVKCTHNMVLVIDGVSYNIPISFETSVNIYNN